MFSHFTENTVTVKEDAMLMFLWDTKTTNFKGTLTGAPPEDRGDKQVKAVAAKPDAVITQIQFSIHTLPTPPPKQINDIYLKKKDQPEGGGPILFNPNTQRQRQVGS